MQMVRTKKGASTWTTQPQISKKEKSTKNLSPTQAYLQSNLE